MGKKEIIKELRNILKVYHYNSDGYMAHISKDVVTKLENLLGQLLKEPPKQLEFPFPEKTIQDPNTQEWNIEYLIKELNTCELGKRDYDIIYEKCNQLKLDLIITPFDIESVDFILNYKVVAFKNASCNMNNYKLIDYMSEKKLPILISTGMWSDEEIRDSIEYFKKKDINYTLLLSNSTYPCPYEDINITYLNTLKKYSNIIGYSGHEHGTFIPIAAAALGARIIEKHITLDKSQDGLDHKASMEPEEWKEMVKNIRLLEKSLGDEKSS